MASVFSPKLYRIERKSIFMQRKKEKKRDNWGELFRTIRKLRLPWVWIIVGLGLNLILSNLMLELPTTTSELMSGNITGAELTKSIVYYIVLGLMSFVMVTGQVQAQSYGAKRTRKAVWQKMLGLRMDFFDQNDPSELMSTMINDAGNAAQKLVNVLIYLIPDIYYVIAALIRIRSYHWILAVSCFSMLPLKYLYALIMGHYVQDNNAKVYHRIGQLTGFLSDRINHLPLIKTYTNEAEEEQNGRNASQELLKANMKLVHLDNISIGAAAVIDIFQKFIVVVVAVLLLQQGEIDITMWLAFFLFSQNLFTRMDEIFDFWLRIKTVHGCFNRMIKIMNAPDEENGAVLPLPEEGDIAFQNVTFTYPGTDAPAMKDVSFTLRRGSCTAIVGLCGSGKTTSISLLERFYAPDEGQISIGGTDIQTISLADYRKHFSYVQQGAEIFSGKLRDALTYGIDRQVSDEEIFSAAEQTGFSEYLALCGNDLNTEVASGGASMSGGQRQRLVLTRELLRGGDIILMDEPTSALDVRVSAKIQQTIDTVFADKTRILITHDLSLAQNYDRILVMNAGQLVGDGTHESLLETCETYRKMAENAGEEAAQ
jgi:ATP-binding cassette, subfamily B, bacterial AbcA/BmrA